MRAIYDDSGILGTGCVAKCFFCMEPTSGSLRRENRESCSFIICGECASKVSTIVRGLGGKLIFNGGQPPKKEAADDET